MDDTGTVVKGCGCCGIIALVFLIIGGIKQLGITEAAIQINWVLQTANSDPVTTPGVRWIGPWNRLAKYPTTTQQVEFKDTNSLHARTKDGLPITINLFFQYTLAADKLFTLYSEYEDEENRYEQIIELTARHRLGEIVTNYTAGELFSDKPRIAAAMTIFLRDYFDENIQIATIESVGLNEEELPEEFTNMITEAGNQKQNITTQNNTKKNMEVEFQTKLQVAEQQANITIQQARGRQSQIIQNGQAEANIIEKYVTVEMGSYSAIEENLDIHGADLVKYLWYDQIGGGGLVSPGDGMHVFAGVSPASYIDSKH